VASIYSVVLIVLFHSFLSVSRAPCHQVVPSRCMHLAGFGTILRSTLKHHCLNKKSMMSTSKPGILGHLALYINIWARVGSGLSVWRMSCTYFCTELDSWYTFVLFSVRGLCANFNWFILHVCFSGVTVIAWAITLSVLQTLGRSWRMSFPPWKRGDLACEANPNILQ